MQTGAAHTHTHTCNIDESIRKYIRSLCAWKKHPYAMPRLIYFTNNVPLSDQLKTKMTRAVHFNHI